MITKIGTNELHVDIEVSGISPDEILIISIRKMKIMIFRNYSFTDLLIINPPPLRSKIRDFDQISESSFYYYNFFLAKMKDFGQFWSLKMTDFEAFPP